MAHLAAAVDGCASLLLQAAAQVAAAAPLDTIVTKQAPIEPGWFERFQETLRALMTLAILVLTVAVVPAAWNFRKSYQKVSDLLDKVYADVTPLTRHASRIAENVDYVTAAVRADTERASALLGDAERRLRATLDRAEARARDLEALLDVAQHEAEQTFVSAAATVAGVREGVASLRADLAAAALGGPALVASSELPSRTAVRAHDPQPEDLSDAEFDDLADPAALRPRVRPRGRA